jgi:cytochrome d ubiquinol oxidase subunit II
LALEGVFAFILESAFPGVFLFGEKRLDPCGHLARRAHLEWLLGFVILMLAGIGGVFHFLRRGRELAAFLSSSAFLLGLFAATMAGLYPVWLRSTIDPAYNLTAGNSAAKSYGLQVALVWWVVGMMLAAVYFVNLFRSNRGKVDVHTHGHSY